MTLKELQSQINKLIEDGHKDKKVLVDGILNECTEIYIDKYGDVIIS